MSPEVRAETDALGGIAIMQSTPEVQAVLTWLVRLLDAKVCVDLGTFTGGSALAMAEAGARVFAFELNPEWARMAERHWTRAGVAAQIHLRVGVADVTWIPERSVDLAFIDADKARYPAYVEALLPRIRPGGVIALDDTDWFGQADRPASRDPAAQVMRSVNQALAADPRVDTLRLSVGNGLTLCRVKGENHA